MMIPELTDTDYVVLGDLLKQYPAEFYLDMTTFFITEMYKYIDTAMVWRCSIMGPTRSGKSEIASSLNFLYKQRFNKNIESGLYIKNPTIKTMFDDEGIKLQKIDYNQDFIYGSPVEYQTKQRERTKNNDIIFGQIHHIDEDSKTAGGLGSMSQAIEQGNINNITAKFMQSETWLTPDYMITKNAPYGLRTYPSVMDRKNLVNYCLLYKIEMNTKGYADFKFLGWVSIPLHPYQEFRVEYNKVKDGWINNELKGGANGRAKGRFEVSQKLAKSKIFKLKESGKTFIHSKSERMAYLEQLMLSGEVMNYNEIEKCRIVEQATLLKKTEDVDND